MSTPQLPSFPALFAAIGIDFRDGQNPRSIPLEEVHAAYADTLKLINADELKISSDYARGIAKTRRADAIRAYEILSDKEKTMSYYLNWCETAIKDHIAKGNKAEVERLTAESAQFMQEWFRMDTAPPSASAQPIEAVEGNLAGHELTAEPSATTNHSDVIDVEAKVIESATDPVVDLAEPATPPVVEPSTPAAHPSIDLSDEGLAATVAEPTTPVADAAPTSEPVATTEPFAATSKTPPADAAPATEAPAAAPAAAPAKPILSESRALTVVETAAEKTAAAEAKSHSKMGLIIAAVVGAVGVGVAAWRSREKERAPAASRSH